VRQGNRNFILPQWVVLKFSEEFGWKPPAELLKEHPLSSARDRREIETILV
jgi:hypothetical protein